MYLICGKGVFLKIDPGTIYFVRETDRETGKLSDLVKIGLVKGKKSPWERLKDHQTGNPRKLVFEDNQFIATNAVGYVEWLIHKTFAAERVGGEWFLLPTKRDVDRVVEKANEIAKAVTDMTPVIEEADRLTHLESTSEDLDANEEIRSKTIAYFLLQKQVTAIGSLKRATMKCFDKVIEEFGTEALVNQVEFTEVVPKHKFSSKIFKEKYPNLYEEYQRTDEELLGTSIKLAFKPEDTDQSNEFVRLKAEIQERNELALSSQNYYLLNENLVILEEYEGYVDWPIKLLEAELKVFCGVAKGVKGLYIWNRHMGQGKPYLSERELIEDHQAEYLDSFDTKKPSLRKKPKLQK
jgi:hypothetical protein